MVRTPVLPPQGTWVRSLVEELRFCKLDSMAKKKKKKKSTTYFKGDKMEKGTKIMPKEKNSKRDWIYPCICDSVCILSV